MKLFPHAHIGKHIKQEAKHIKKHVKQEIKHLSKHVEGHVEIKKESDKPIDIDYSVSMNLQKK